MITTNSALIEGYHDSDTNHAMARIDPCLSGCGVQIRLINLGATCGCYWLARLKDDERNDYVLLLPSPRWEQDARDAGFELIQKLNHR